VPKQVADQETQVGNSDLYDDEAGTGVALETGAHNLRDDLNALRSQAKRIIHGDEDGDWYDDPVTILGTDISLRALLYSGLGFNEDKILVNRDGTVVVNQTSGNVVRIK
jgi:hypothetical protein